MFLSIRRIVSSEFLKANIVLEQYCIYLVYFRYPCVVNPNNRVVNLEYTFNVAAATEVCPKGCYGRGTCFNSTCSCNPGFGGDDCFTNILNYIEGNLGIVTLETNQFHIVMIQREYSTSC